MPFGDNESLRVLHVLGCFVVEAVRSPEKFQLPARSITDVKRITATETLVRFTVRVHVGRR